MFKVEIGSASKVLQDIPESASVKIHSLRQRISPEIADERNQDAGNRGFTFGYER